MRFSAIVGIMALSTTPALAGMEVELLSDWDGKKVPEGQQCDLFGGLGATPPMEVTDVPSGTEYIVVEYNDKSFKPLSTNGGHGIIAYPAKAGRVITPAVPGKTAKLPRGALVVKAARSTGAYASPGYLPPCSGGRGNRYTADVKAVAPDGRVLDQVTDVPLGTY